VITFDPHPKEVVASARGPVELLSTIDERLARIASLGVDLCIVIEFTYAFSRQTPREFAERILVRGCGLREMVVGHDHMFGRDREAGTEGLARLGAEFGFSVAVVEPVLFEGAPVSSTRIRRALAEGRVEEARSLLGAPYVLSGTVVTGDRRGQSLGFPTANLGGWHPRKVIPANGVYLVHATVAGARHPGMMNIGVRPTVTTAGVRTLEAHLLDVDADLYGAPMEVAFERRLRDERRFGSLAELMTQLHADRDTARRWSADEMNDNA
jgi:riboflavin kinase/FMN adenylyltransferase